MSGRMSRNKGARGQSEFKAMLLDRDWRVDSLTAGIASADLVATDPLGRAWCVEVKNCAGILPAHKKQAVDQGIGRLQRPAAYPGLTMNPQPQLDLRVAADPLVRVRPEVLADAQREAQPDPGQLVLTVCPEARHDRLQQVPRTVQLVTVR